MADLLRTYIVNSLHEALAATFPDSGLTPGDIVLEIPRQQSHGDIATPLAMQAAKIVRLKPPEVARRIMANFPWDSSFIVEDRELATTVMGGFINFRTSPAYLYLALRDAVCNPESFGRNQVEYPLSILYEFVSANPTGPMVVVNARAAAVGDTLARINEWIGHKVHREYYVNDHGNQIALFGKSLACRYRQHKGEECPLPEGGYEGEYVTDLAIRIAQLHPGIASLSGADAAELFGKEALEHTIRQQQEILRSFRVEYDTWYRESELHASGSVEQARQRLESKGLLFESENAIWFKSSAFGDEKDRVIIRSDGSPTYFLADMAYHVHKASRGFDSSYTFWGPDHHGYLARLEAAIAALDLKPTVFFNFIIQQVSLIRDGKPFRMSKRKGDFVTISDLVEEAGVDAARYFFLTRRLSSHFDFDLDLAMKQTDENPVFYVQYAHARTCSLIGHAQAQGFSEDDIAAASPDLLTEPEELALCKQIAQFPRILHQIAGQCETQRMTTYVETMASLFHQFYQKHRIVTEDRARSLSRLFLTTAVRNTIRVALGLMGVSSPERM